ncbi:MAG: DUF3971 domain-containing protein, partial [Paracoccaceae bacterium]
MSSGEEHFGPPEPAVTAPVPRRFRRHGWAMLRSALGMVLFLGLIVAGTIFSVMAVTGKTLSLPDVIVDSIEKRIAASLPPGLSVDLGGVEVLVDDGWIPRLRVQDMRLTGAEGATLVALPDARVVFDGASFAKGEVRPTTLRLTGAEVALRRDKDGRFNLDFGAGEAAQAGSFADLLDQAEAAFDVPVFSALQSIDIIGLRLTLTDDLTGQVWQVQNGRLSIANRKDTLAAELGLSLSGAVDAGQVQLSFATSKADSSATITAQVTGIAANDLASQVAPLAFLQVLQAPLTGSLSASLDGSGDIATLDGTLDIASGTLTPAAETTPLAFESANLTLSYDPALARLKIARMSVRSATAAFDATGHVTLHDAQGQSLTAARQGSLPAAFVAQLELSDMRVDPDGQFATPVTFASGALDLRLTLNPFRIDIGQFSLVEGDQHLRVSGWAEGRDNGLHGGLDVALDEIPAARLVALWPLRLVPKTREWLVANVQQGTLSNVNGAVRLAPGTEPRLQLGYEFKDAEVRFLRTLPPIKSGVGYATLDGKRYVIVLDQGTVTPPQGGDINVAGSVFEIADITQRPNIASIRLATTSTVTAALSLLDLPPFGFMTKADRPVDLGEGTAQVETRLTIPLVARVQLADVDYTVSGRISDFSTEKLVPGRRVQADSLALAATPAGMEITGPGRLGRLPFDVTYSQSFSPAQRGRSRIEGVVTLSNEALTDLGIALPDGFLRGEGTAEVTIALRRGEPAELTLQSRLAGIGLSVPELGWSKPRDARASFALNATLSTPPRVTELSLDAAGLEARGDISLREGGGLREARFTELSVDDWFDAAVTLTG